MSEAREDDLLRLRRELAEAEATIAALRRENAALGSGRAAARDACQAEPAHGQAYRSMDVGVQLEASLEEAIATVADLRIENAILRSRAASRVPWRAAAMGLAAVAGAAVVLGVIWLISSSLGLLLFVVVMGALGAVVVHLIGGIPPNDGGPPPGPPLIPGG